MTDRTTPEAAPAAGPWERAALGGVLLLAAGLRLAGLEQVGYGNLYYAAAVQSMGRNWPAFFYAAFDSAGFVSVDKPPLGLWVQVLSTKLLGFNGWALLLPQALAGALAVALIYWLTRRAFGPRAGWLAALILALTPINVAADRNNTMDAQLVLTSLLAGWAALRAAETGRLRWLLVGAVWLGVGFNIKMLQALLIAPAVFGLYLLAAPVSFGKRLVHLTAASLLLAALALAWPLAVDLTPAEQRPFVGSSTDNTLTELILGHNGLERLGPIAQWVGLRPGPGPAGPPAGDASPVNPPPAQRPQNQPQGGAGPPGNDPQPPAGGNGPGQEIGVAGLLRLFGPQLAAQASWFLPLALAGLILLSVRAGRGWSRSQINLWFWGLWLIPPAVFFSYAGLFHRYYLEMLSPAIAALAGASLAEAWAQLRAGRRGPLLAALLVTAAGAALIVRVTDTAGWSMWLIPLSAGTAGLGVLGLAVAPAAWRNSAAALGLAGVFIAPGAYALTPVLAAGDIALPYAGQELLARPARAISLPARNRLTQFLLDRQTGETFLAAAPNANTAAPLSLATGRPVMAVGGFSGGDRILSAAGLAQRVAAGQVRYILWPAGGRAAGVGNGPAVNQPELTQWIQSRCRQVPEREWQDPGVPAAGPGANGPQQLWDCAAAR